MSQHERRLPAADFSLVFLPPPAQAHNATAAPRSTLHDTVFSPSRSLGSELGVIASTGHRRRHSSVDRLRAYRPASLDI